MENKTQYIAPEITVAELSAEDVIMISIATDVTGTLPELPYDPSLPPLY